MIKAVIFDFFDVIRTDTYNAWLKKNGIVREGKFHEITQLLDAGKIDFDEFFRTVSRLSGKTLTREIMESYAKVNYDVLDVIKELKKNYKVALLSNALSSFLREILKSHDLEKYFDEIVISSEVGHIKPNREIFEIALKRLGVAASETIFTDDSLHNIKGAEKIGIRGIHFVDAKQLRKELVAAGLL